MTRSMARLHWIGSTFYTIVIGLSKDEVDVMMLVFVCRVFYLPITRTQKLNDRLFCSLRWLYCFLSRYHKGPERTLQT